MPTFCTILKINFRNFAKNFVKRILTLSFININIRSKLKFIKTKIYFSNKKPIHDDLKSFIVYKFTCASFSFSYFGKTYCHFKTRIEQYIKKERKSHIFKHLHSTKTCLNSYKSLPVKIIDKANSKFALEFKKALHINWRKPNLNTHKNI